MSSERDKRAAYPIGTSIELAALAKDPFPIYTRLRESEPVSFVSALGIYFVTRYDDVRTVMEDDEHFVVGTEASIVYDIFGEHMMTVEDPLHAHYKRAHQAFFQPPAIKQSLEPVIRRHADALIDEFASGGEVELREAFASRLPILTMLSLFGLDLDEESQLRRMYDSFEAALSNFTWDETVRASGKRSAEEFHALIQSYLDRMRDDEQARRDGSLLASLLDADERQRLSDAEICHNAGIIFFGGISTVEALIMNTIYALSNYPAALEQVHRDLSLLPKAITETIRWLGPVQSATRHVAKEVDVLGHTFRPGDTVNCMLGSANRDSSQFDRPDEYDLHRDNARRHVGFATGPHHCLGSHLARAEARIALEQLFDRLQGFCFDLERTGDPEGYEFRQPSAATAAWSTS